MISIRDLEEQLTGELQGEVVVKQWNYDAEDFDFITPLYELPDDSPIWDRPIKYMYADLENIQNGGGHPVLFIEVDGDYD